MHRYVYRFTFIFTNIKNNRYTSNLGNILGIVLYQIHPC